MTGGRVVVLGGTGRNFAAGMSGGIAYVFDWDNEFNEQVNLGMVDVEPLHEEERQTIHDLIEQHVEMTHSQLGRRILADWGGSIGRLRRVIPRDYQRVLTAIDTAKAERANGP